MNNQHHYFIETTHSLDDYFKFDYIFFDKKFIFNSCSDIFSKDYVDYGTQVLLKTIKNYYISNIGQNVLDLGCGYGVIGIVLSKFFESNYLLVDINNTCVQLSKKILKRIMLKMSKYFNPIYLIIFQKISI